MYKAFIIFVTGIIVGGIIFSAGESYAVKKYVMSREPLADFSDASVPVLNRIIRDIWWSIDDIDARLVAGGH